MFGPRDASWRANALSQARALVEGLGAQAETFLRLVLAARLGEFTAEALKARQAGQSQPSNAIAALLHGCASLLYALAAASLAPPPPEAALEQLVQRASTARLDSHVGELSALVSWSLEELKSQAAG